MADVFRASSAGASIFQRRWYDDAVKEIAVIASRALLTRCGAGDQLRIATASLAVASSFLALALLQKALNFTLNGDIVATCESTYSCNCDDRFISCLLQICKTSVCHFDA